MRLARKCGAFKGIQPVPAFCRPKTEQLRPGLSGRYEAENHLRDKLLGNTADCACAKTGHVAKGGGKDKARKRHDREEARRAKLSAKEQRRSAKGSKKKDDSVIAVPLHLSLDVADRNPV